MTQTLDSQLPRALGIQSTDSHATEKEVAVYQLLAAQTKLQIHDRLNWKGQDGNVGEDI